MLLVTAIADHLDKVAVRINIMGRVADDHFEEIIEIITRWGEVGDVFQLSFDLEF